ncbi:Uncharacterised protein [Mycolicibacterium fortuitum]|uniref:DNA primase/nucleoside triphosphatase C-terminal domain-containing protein n=1 Tax=Mycolicibacterium fortuitum TaxID=1766 RepID=A0A378U6X5_MYCFO|nr:Uncharacterised protein [Mycolicibacterium fortuitum]
MTNTLSNIVRALASIQYDEGAQHERAMNAMSLVRDDIADGRNPDQRLITIALACACRVCLDGMVEQADELGPWLAVAEPSPPSPLERFVAECCELTPGSPSDVTPADFCEAYLCWARGNGENTAGISTIGLGRELSARFGVRSTPIRSVRIYKGLALRQPSAATGEDPAANSLSRAAISEIWPLKGVVVSTPRGLKAGGRRLWDSVTSDFDLDESASAVLAQACYTVDELADLRAKLAEIEPVIESSQGVCCTIR